MVDSGLRAGGVLFSILSARCSRILEIGLGSIFACFLLDMGQWNYISYCSWCKIKASRLVKNKCFNPPLSRLATREATVIYHVYK